MYTIKTEVLGNIDKGQNPNKPPWGVDIVTITGDTYVSIQDQVSDWIGENDIGGGEWCMPPVYKDGKVIGYMSYNGRLWESQSWMDTTQQIHINEGE